MSLYHHPSSLSALNILSRQLCPPVPGAQGPSPPMPLSPHAPLPPCPSPPRPLSPQALVPQGQVPKNCPSSQKLETGQQVCVAALLPERTSETSETDVSDFIFGSSNLSIDNSLFHYSLPLRPLRKSKFVTCTREIHIRPIICLSFHCKNSLYIQWRLWKSLRLVYGDWSSHNS